MQPIRSLGFLLLRTRLLAGLALSLFALTLYGADDELPAIGQLKTPEYLILIHASAEGTLYTIKTHDGVVIERELPERYMASLYPELYETLQRGIADPSDASSKVIHLPRDLPNNALEEAFP